MFKTQAQYTEVRVQMTLQEASHWCVQYTTKVLQAQMTLQEASHCRVLDTSTVRVQMTRLLMD